MAEPDDQNPQWPDFLPPDFAESIEQAPREPSPNLPPPIPINRPRQQPPRPRPRKADPERWFNQPAPGGASRRSFLPAPDSPTTVTFTLMAICVAVWVLQSLFPLFDHLVTLVPALGASEPWRFITSAFAHAPRSFSHIGFNMLTLWLMGRFLEPILGHRNFLIVYLIAALGGGAAFVLLAFPPGQGPGSLGTGWNTGVVGASGAVFGLFGAYLVIAWALKRPLTAIWVLLGLNVATALIFPGIAWMSHLGGFIAGAAATAVLVGDLKRRRTSQRSLSVPGLIAIVVVIVGALVVKYAITA